MRYCKKCVLPSTRPSVTIGEAGICSACRNHERLRDVDWAMREKQFAEEAERAISMSNGYDCIIPVSGGKDSHWQVVKCLEYDLYPLTVTWEPPEQTELGRKNLKNLKSLGVDHISYSINPDVERKFLYRSLVENGATGIPKHMALYHIPLKLAYRFDIPLVVWGENSAMIYGDLEEDEEGDEMQSRRYSSKGVTDGTEAEDWISDDLTRQELTPYFGPGKEELAEKSIRSIYLGYFFDWDPRESLNVARRHGFESETDSGDSDYYAFSDLESNFVAIHHYLKWYKFGITRLFHNISFDIRNERISRDEAVEVIRERVPGTPFDTIRRFTEFVGMEPKGFYREAERFRNREIWSCRDGQWVMDDFLIQDPSFWNRYHEELARLRDGSF